MFKNGSAVLMAAMANIFGVEISKTIDSKIIFKNSWQNPSEI